VVLLVGDVMLCLSPFVAPLDDTATALDTSVDGCTTADDDDVSGASLAAPHLLRRVLPLVVLAVAAAAAAVRA
jgi:hypothetical protein